MAQPTLTQATVTLSDLKNDPLAVLDSGHGGAVAVTVALDEEPTFYCVPAAQYRDMLLYVPAGQQSDDEPKPKRSMQSLKGIVKSAGWLSVEDMNKVIARAGAAAAAAETHK